MISFIHNESEIGWGIASKPKAQNRKQKNQKNIFFEFQAANH